MKNAVKPTSVSEATFEAEVLNSEIPVIVDIWAQWCAPCRMLAPMLDKFASELAGVVKIVKLNRDENEALAKDKLGANSIPRLQVFQGGKQVGEQIGLPDYTNLKDWLISTLAKIDIECGADTDNEQSYADAVAAAFKAMEETVAPASAAYSEAIKPFVAKIDAYKEELTGDGLEGDELKAKLQARQKELMPEIQPALDAYQAASQPAEAKFIQDIEAATAAFVNGSGKPRDTSSTDQDESGQGKVCEIGDPNCQS